MSGTNCYLAAPSMNYVGVRATQVAYGMDVITYAADGQSRNGSTFYPAKRADSDIDLTLIFSDRQHYIDVNRWLQRYVDRVSNPSASASPIRIILPARKFDMTAVLKSGIVFGRKVGEVTFGMTLSFSGARSPMSLKSEQVSSFALPTSKQDASLPYFYPGGTQLKGTTYGWDTLYDEPAGWSLLSHDNDGSLTDNGVIPGMTPSLGDN